MNYSIREATLNDFDKGLLKVFIEGYRYHQNGRPDIFANISDNDLKNDLIENFDRLNGQSIFQHIFFSIIIYFSVLL